MEGSSFFFISPISVLKDVGLRYWAPLLAAVTVLTYSIYRRQKQALRQWLPVAPATWWVLPLLLWAFVATSSNIRGYGVITHSPRSWLLFYWMDLLASIGALFVVGAFTLAVWLLETRWAAEPLTLPLLAALAVLSAVAAVLLDMLLILATLNAVVLNTPEQGAGAL
jgi:hypothetical protein